MSEYNQTNSLSDQTRRKLVNILVADMVESHGRIPPVNVRITYALGIVTLFPNLEDKCSQTGYVGTSFRTFLDNVGSTQPFLLCVGERRSSIQTFYIILDQKAIPCMTQTAVAAFDELFKAHFVFAVSYDEALCNFFTCMALMWAVPKRVQGSRKSE